MDINDGNNLSRKPQEDFQFESTQLLSFSFLGWFKQLTANPMALRLTQIVRELACHVGLSKRQHIRLNQLAWGLQSLIKSSSTPLNEESLVAVLAGDSNAEATLSKRLGLQKKRFGDTPSKLLASLRVWFQSLSFSQQQIVVSMQQRAFRLSMG